MEYIIHSGELYHYGRKGMKWGQNIFGKVKARRTAKQRSKNLAKAREVRAERKKALAKGRISPKKMTEAELKKQIERLQLEKQYIALVKDTKAANYSRGRRFVDKFVDSTIDKVADNAAADVVAQSLKVLTTVGANKAFNKYGGKLGVSGDQVFTNNKKKS